MPDVGRGVRKVPGSDGAGLTYRTREGTPNPNIAFILAVSGESQELVHGQMVPASEEISQMMGFKTCPVSFSGIAGGHIRRMAGNSFHQACFVAWVCYVLSKVYLRRPNGSESEV